MFRIHIARNRQPIGEFTPEEVAEGLQTGKFLATDLGWREPMTAWKPLEEWDNLPTVAVTPPPLSDSEPAMTAPTDPSKVEPAWERRAELGIIPALYESIRQIYASPTATFQAMPKTGGLKTPLFFYLIIATLATWASIGYQAAVYQMNPEAFAQLPKSMTPSMVVTSQIATVILTPGFLVIWAFIMGGVFHLILSALGATQGSFEASFRVFCYAGGAAFVLQFIPICGPYLFWGVLIALLTIAFREVHRISSWQAFTGAMVPVLLCCGLALAGMAAAMGAAALK